MRPMMTGSGKRGVTLISVMVAASIVGVALTMALSAFVGGSRLTRSAAGFAAASSFAESILEDTRSKPFASIAGSTVTQGLPALPGAACEVQVTPRGTALKEVLVTVSWDSDGRRRSARLATLVGKGGSR